MPIDKTKILNFIAEKAYRPLKIRELAKGMRVPEDSYGSFRRVIRSMLREGLIVKIRKNRLGLPEKLNLVVGKLNSSKSGFGFVQSDDGREEIYINQEDLGTALHGDRVVVRIYGKRTGKTVKRGRKANSKNTPFGQRIFARWDNSPCPQTWMAIGSKGSTRGRADI